MDYGTRIADATNTKNASYGTYNEYAGQANQAYDKYNQQFDQRQGYGDIYDAARQKYMNTDEINNARGTYQNSRDAIDQINTTINKLPESIRQQYGGTGLTEAQRARALGDQHAQMANTYNYLNTNYQNATADYQDLVNRAMSEVQNVAGGNYQSQEDALNALQSNWGTLLGQRNTAYNQYQQDVASLQGVNSEQDRWNLAQQQMELERWKEQQANARAQKRLNLQSYLANQQAANDAENRKFQTELQKQQQNASRLADATLASDKANAQAAADKKEFMTGNFFNDYGSSIAKYGPLALFGKGWGW